MTEAEIIAQLENATESLDDYAARRVLSWFSQRLIDRSTDEINKLNDALKALKEKQSSMEQLIDFLRTECEILGIKTIGDLRTIMQEVIAERGLGGAGNDNNQ